ncbi:MAG: hypothetical protein IIC91_10545 [Chloroflexi bacterium]|nr:hypothetical protein [Chloroflexota bacterium]
MAVLLAVACSSGSPTLQLRTGPITEDAFRIQIRQTAFVQPVLFRANCSPLTRYSPMELLEAFESLVPFVTPGAQTRFDSDDEITTDEVRAIEIIREECERLEDE